jgi:2-amino-4-hydroxy-6-hydroxymethyldihydropteridine diphosphokinase
MHCLVYLSVGSNLGDKRANCQHGLAALEARGAARVRRLSSFYRTDPVDYIHQDWFVNAVAEADTALDPLALLAQIQEVQAQAGRLHDAVRYGPRVLDIDILLFDQRVLDGPALQVPHPRLHERRFVLQPLCDINPALVHPLLGVTMQELLDRPAVRAQGVWVLP